LNTRPKSTNYLESRELLRDEDLNLAPLTWLGNLRKIVLHREMMQFNAFGSCLCSVFFLPSMFTTGTTKVSSISSPRKHFFLYKPNFFVSTSGTDFFGHCQLSLLFSAFIRISLFLGNFTSISSTCAELSIRFTMFLL
jgi:hypothetical protein